MERKGMESGETTLEYTFDIRRTVRVRIPAGVPGDDPDNRALAAASEELGVYLYWNDVTVMDVEEIPVETPEGKGAAA